MANTLISYLNKRLTRTAPPGKEIKQPGPVITISRQVGCSGLELAYALADILNKTSSMEGWKVLSKEILNHSARELDLEPGRIARIFKQQDRSTIDEIISAFSEKKFKSDKKIKKTVIEVIRNFAEDGFCIIVGRGSNIIAADIPNSLHIRLEAPLEDRIISIMNKNGWNREESIRFIERVEKERYAYRHAVMQELNQEEDHFDITFNRSRLNTTVIAGLIMEAIREKKILAGYSQKIDFF
jgi:cytidylate kinase